MDLGVLNFQYKLIFTYKGDSFSYIVTINLSKEGLFIHVSVLAINQTPHSNSGINFPHVTLASAIVCAYALRGIKCLPIYPSCHRDVLLSSAHNGLGISLAPSQ